MEIDYLKVIFAVIGFIFLLMELAYVVNSYIEKKKYQKVLMEKINFFTTKMKLLEDIQKQLDKINKK